MKMKYSLILLFCFGISCNFLSQKNAIKYNDIIINSQRSISDRFTDISNAFLSDDSLRMFQSLKSLNTTIDSAIIVVSDLSSLDGSTEMRDAALQLFKFYKKVGEQQYVEIVNILLKEETSEEDAERLNVIEKEISLSETELDKNFTEAQLNLSKKYGFKLNQL